MVSLRGMRGHRNIWRIAFIAAAFAAQLISARASVREIFVSPSGDDSAAGTFDAPFATVARARDAVREAKAAGALHRGGATVWLRGGEYQVRETIAFDSRDSGSPDAPVAYRAWKDETPVLTGAWTVPPSAWRLADDPRIPAEAKGKVWAADVKSLGYDALEPDAPCGYHTARPRLLIRSLYCDGKRLHLARHPNEGFFRVGEVVDQECAFKADIGDMARWAPANAPCLEALGYWHWLWADQTLPVAVDPAEGTISFATADKANDGVGKSFHFSQITLPSKSRFYNLSVTKGRPFFLQNALGALDAPGEWYLDGMSGMLYVYPKILLGGGKRRGPRRYELSLMAHSLVVVKGASHVRFEGIVFRGGRHHGMELCGVSDVVLEGCVFRDLGGHGLLCRNMRDSLVRGCVFHTFGHCAMTLDGGDRKALAPSGVTVEACDFGDTGLAMRTYTPGIWVTGCGHRIVRSYFHDFPSSAMRVGGNEHLIASNVLERAVLESDDQGAVDMWGDPTYRGNKFIHNVFRDIGRGGAFVKCGQGGIRLDDAISGNLVYGNRFIDCSKGHFGGVQIHGGRDNVVRNNVFTRCAHGITVTPWTLDKWREFNSGEKHEARCRAANVDGAAFRAKYPEFGDLLDTPMRNTFECNVFEGDGKPPEAGFEPLPPESAIGPGSDAVLEKARERDANC